mmetsp:Transcript_11229/g.35606  ORF Transcript_11229/g.35606 Transcript_11229/m.35606 type:complete len:159 (+) Transcript_11229:78-554(+)|eukprot:CAMPEP_0182865206 /NCGR_PEP_ID=MMETSP0034_2-20130328/7569_1 /TAXON_ID=156128 /ORGANISM="Nephroselmis pyriformis, Strain CCMP717" /LENGTH=158 /DNA_ID=CAMNT_0024997495 /DNA_START=56 /DNA_END=532 /DNA_ORIENTATION=-
MAEPAVDLEGEEEMIEDTMDDGDEEQAANTSGKKQKGRGFQSSKVEGDRYGGARFESLDGDAKGPSGPARSVEGWIIIVSNVHEEAQEDDIHEAFADFGEIKNMHLNLDRRTGFVKGYALIEYEKQKEAQEAITAMNGAELLTQTLAVDWAFSKGGRR